MSIYIKGYEKSSLVEWPGKVVSIIFTAGCNFRCPFCHNRNLVEGFDEFEDLSFNEVLENIKSRRKWIDAIEITGGEPTLHPQIIEILERIKKEGFLVKLDTNGTIPNLLKEFFEKNLVDYVAMDIKNSEEKYSETAGAIVDLNKIKESIKLIMENAPDYEFRTTILPRHHKEEDFEKIGKMIEGSKRYYLQNFNAGNCLDPEYNKEDNFNDESLKNFKEILKKYVKEVNIR